MQSPQTNIGSRIALLKSSETFNVALSQDLFKCQVIGSLFNYISEQLPQHCWKAGSHSSIFVMSGHHIHHVHCILYVSSSCSNVYYHHHLVAERNTLLLKKNSSDLCVPTLIAVFLIFTIFDIVKYIKTMKKHTWNHVENKKVGDCIQDTDDTDKCH